MPDTQSEKREDGSVSEQPEAIMGMLVGRRRELMEALGKVDAEVSEVQAELNKRIDEARIRRQPIEEALGHLDAFLRIEGWVESGEGNVHHVQALSGNGKTPAEAAHDLLSTLGKPLHYRLLALKLSESGVYLAGKDPAATLLSQMSRDERFKRAPERGVYGLTSWRMRRSPSKNGKAKPRRSKNTRT